MEQFEKAPRIDALGDRALVITVGDSADERTRLAVRACYERLRARPPRGMHDIVPGFTTVTVHYDPAAVQRAGATPFDAAVAAVRDALANRAMLDAALSRVIEIPVCYDASVAPDLGDVAAHARISPEQVAELHAAPEYVVHMIGFLPGFPYLGGLDQRLEMPRRATPRTRVPAGSVAIGGAHTGVYTIDSPGGWHVIGRTPLRLFDVERDPPAMLGIGDRVRFRPIPLRDLQAADRT
jgi:inhibitor of KinA